MIKRYNYELFGCCQGWFTWCLLCLFAIRICWFFFFAELLNSSSEMRTTIGEGLRLNPQLSAEGIGQQRASLTCVVSISSQGWRLTWSSQRARKRAAPGSKDEIYNRKSGERMLGQDNPLLDRRHCWHSFHRDLKWIREEPEKQRGHCRSPSWKREIKGCK